MDLAALCRSHMDFTPTEIPAWRPDGPTTSQMLQDMAVWTAKFMRSPAAVAFADYNHWEDAAGRFVVSSNVCEEVGLASVEETKVLLGCGGNGRNGAELEVIRLGMALQALKQHYDLRLGCAERQWQALAMTPDMVLEVQRTLVGVVACRLWTQEAQTVLVDGGAFTHPEASLVPGLVQSLCDLFNAMLETLEKNSSTGMVLQNLYKLAALLFVQFVTVRPFLVANERMARLLAAFVLWGVTPFPVTPVCDAGTRHRELLLRTVEACRSSVCPDTFLGLLPPCDFAALLIESGWRGWQDFVGRFQRSLAMSGASLGDGMAVDNCAQENKADLELDDLIWHVGTSLSLA